ncbi:hypothetical protein FACS189485_15800 [Spirochaetia bacterium]|nr:hypothetical protein FACS189485_15800 [Spirochaetia bacterium]
MSDPKEATKVEKPPIFNRGRFIKIAAITVAVFVVIGLIAGQKPKDKAALAAIDAAADVKPPDFGDYRGRAQKDAALGDEFTGYTETPSFYQEDGNGETQRLPVKQNAPPEYYGGSPARSNGSSNGNKTPQEVARESSLIPELQGALYGGFRASPQVAQQGISGTAPTMLALPPSFQSASPPPNLSEMFAAAMSDGSGGTSYNSQNMQGNKQEFYPGNQGNSGTATGHFLEGNTVWNGSIIPAVLITGINTDLPGDIQARVTQNIYDSLTGKKLLIPQGSILLASYNSSVSFAQSRVQIAWNTLIRPDGFQIDLGTMNAVDAEGLAGMKGHYSENLFQYLKAAGIISLFSILNGEISRSGGGDNARVQEMTLANQNVVNQLGAKMIDRALDIQPTITVKNGTQINIMLNKNVMLPPIDDYPVTTKYARR